MSQEIMYILMLFCAVILGVAVGFLYSKMRYSGKGLLPEDIQKDYVRKEVFAQVEEQNDFLREDLRERETELRGVEQTLAGVRRDMMHLEAKLSTSQEEFSRLQAESEKHFENIANRLLEEKSERFAKQNQRQLQETLMPLKEKINEFEQGIVQKFTEEAKDKSVLQEQIRQLAALNMQLSSDAQKLVTALKGDNKTQGDWGELQLETLLQRAGLQKGIHFDTQNSYKDKEGKNKRPDFIINLPDGKHLIIDSKVSLKAYEQFYNTEDELERSIHLKQHISSLRNHIKDLSSKNYQQLYQINSPDYLLLFVPIEPAFSCAVKEDGQLFTDALDRNIVMVSTSTLLATMRTVAYIWKQEKQKKNVIEIARQSGLLYDRFVAFVEDMKAIGQRLDGAQSAWHDAMNKLKYGKRNGNTLIGRAERIRQLGAKTSKVLPNDLLEDENQ